MHMVTTKSLLNQLHPMVRISRRSTVTRILAALLALAVTVACSQDSKGTGLTSAPLIPVKAATVKEAPISRTATFSGTVLPVDQVELVPGIAARVQRINYGVGDTVLQGAALVELDRSSLESGIKQAQAGLLSARARLDQMLEGARAEDVAMAKAQLQAQRAKLDGILAGGRPEQVVSAEASLTATKAKLADIEAGAKVHDIQIGQISILQAESVLETANANLKQLNNPGPLDIQAAQVGVDAAKTALDAAEAAQLRLLNPTAEDVGALGASIAAAESGLRSAEATLADLKLRPKPEELNAGQAAVAEAKAAYDSTLAIMESFKMDLNEVKVRNVINARLRLREAREKLERDKAAGASQQQLDKDNEELILAYRAVDNAEDDLNWTRPGVSSDDILVAQANSDAALARLKSAQQNLESIKKGPTQAQISSAELLVEQAKSSLTLTRSTLIDLTNPASNIRQTAETAVETARASLAGAQIKLEQLKNPRPADIQSAKSAVDGAKATISAAQARLDNLLKGATLAELEGARAAVVQADTQLSLTRSPYTISDIRAQEELVNQLASQHDKAGSPYTSADISVATASIAVAEAALDSARIMADNAVITAPFNAIVAKKYLSPGAMASQQSPVLSLVSQSMKIEFSAEEAAIGLLRVGQRTAITLSAYPEESLSGTVSNLSPTADPATRAFTVTIMPNEGMSLLKGGMYTNIEVILGDKSSAKVVPSEAVLEKDGKSLVFVIVDDVVQMKEIKTGIRNSGLVEVSSGLDLGDNVVVQGIKSIKDGDRVRVLER